MPDPAHNSIPVVPFLTIGADGTAHLTGARCGKCGAIYVGDRTICGACGARDAMAAIELSRTGRLHSYTIVHRSFPGVKTPFVAAVVDLDGGGSLKGTLIDVTPDPAAIAFDMPVQVVVRDTGQSNAQGQPFVAYFFKPGEAA